MTDSDRCSAGEAAAILGLTYPSTFHRVRRRMQKILAHPDGPLRTYPSDFASADAERDFCRQHVIVVPEWGGVSYFGGRWSFLRSRCTTFPPMSKQAGTARGNGESPRASVDSV